MRLRIIIISPPYSRYTDVSRKMSSLVVGNALQNRTFSLMASPSIKMHTGQELIMSTHICRLEFQCKFPTDACFFQNNMLMVCRHVTNTSANCIIREGDFKHVRAEYPLRWLSRQVVLMTWLQVQQRVSQL